MPKMKTDQPTICEMRERLEKAKEWHQPCYEDWLSRNSWILELASAELARREREAERDKRCASCGHRRARHFGKHCSNGGKLIVNRCKCTGFTESPVPDGEAGHPAFRGCACADEIMNNPKLREEREEMEDSNG